MSAGARPRHPITPDGRYFVVRGRLWRCSNPALPVATHKALTAELMAARRALVGRKGGGQATAAVRAQRRAARADVQRLKEALGERGAVWWQDGAPDYNRFLAKNSPYAAWWRRQQAEGEG